MQKVIPTWIVVTDSARACFYKLHEKDGVRGIEQGAEPMVSHIEHHSADLKSDRPGRSFSSANGVRHAVEPHHDYHKLEKHDFMQSVARFLEQAFDLHAFERLVLVAPERSIGELRKLLPKKVEKCIWHEIGHDLMKLNAQELWLRIAPELKEHVRAAD